MPDQMDRLKFQRLNEFNQILRIICDSAFEKFVSILVGISVASADGNGPKEREKNRLLGIPDPVIRRNAMNHHDGRTRYPLSS